MAESEEELKRLLMRVKEDSERAGLKLNVKNTKIMTVCVLSQSIVSDSLQPHDCSPPGSCVMGILQARIPEWVAMPPSRRYSQARDRT